MSVDGNLSDSQMAVVEAKNHLVDDIQDVRSRVCNAMLIALSITVIPALLASLYRAVDIGWQPIMAFHILLVISILTLTSMRHHIAYRYRAGFLIVFLLLLVSQESHSLG